MGIFTRSYVADFNQELENYHNSKNAVLLDMRTPEEYENGRVPGSRNLPLHQIAYIQKRIYNKNTPLYIYCHSGRRSKEAAEVIKQMGYTNVNDMGGIIQYRGEVEKS